MSTSPYEPPHAGPPAGGPAGAADQLAIPAIILIVIGVLGLLHRLVDMIVVLVTGGTTMRFPGADGEEFQLGIAPYIIGAIIGGTLSLLVILGGISMKSVRNYPMALTGAIIACIPCCGPCLILAIPFGIWSLILLFKPEIKAAFA